MIAFASQLYYKPPEVYGRCRVMHQESVNLVEFQRRFATEKDIRVSKCLRYQELMFHAPA